MHDSLCFLAGSQETDTFTIRTTDTWSLPLALYPAMHGYGSYRRHSFSLRWVYADVIEAISACSYSSLGY